MKTKIFYVTRIVEKGTKQEHLITWEGPFDTLAIARAKQYAVQHVQPQFEFVVEREEASGLVVICN